MLMNFQQVIIRGDGKEKFNQIINKEISILPPSKNLEVTKDDKFMFAKNSFAAEPSNLKSSSRFVISFSKKTTSTSFNLLVFFYCTFN